MRKIHIYPNTLGKGRISTFAPLTDARPRVKSPRLQRSAHRRIDSPSRPMVGRTLRRRRRALLGRKG